MPVAIPETEVLTEEELLLAEQALGCRLPESFRVFVQRHNGAIPEENVFSIRGNESSVRRLIPVGDAAALRDQIDGFPKYAVPVAEDECGNFVWLDPKTGTVFFWDHEVQSRGRKIASDFDSFLCSLRKFDPRAEPEQAVRVISVWADPDFLAQLKGE
jgi:hypothetical protein